MNAHKSPKKKSSGTPIIFWLTIAVIVIGSFIFLAFHAGIQLSIEQQNTKLFITNQIHKFEETIITKVDAGKEDLKKIVQKIVKRKPSFEETFEANSNKSPPIINVGITSNVDLEPIVDADPIIVEDPVIEEEPVIVVAPVIVAVPTAIASSITPVQTQAVTTTTIPVKAQHLPSHELLCPHASLVKFWKPTTPADLAYVSPFAIAGAEARYVTFEPDVGGWNNIRMQMETVTVFAAATARILVLPPDQPMYLLNAGKGHQKAHSFADFFPFDLINQRTPVISMDEFMRREGVTGRLKKLNTEEVLLPPGNKTEFVGTVRDDRLSMWWYLRNVSACPAWKSMKEFCVIPFAPGVNVTLLPDAAAYKERLHRFAAKRSPQYYDDEWQKHKVVHFQSNPGSGFRLLEHFYTFIHFEDPKMDRYYKRFVRDFVHYTDTIFCKAAIIINKLKEEGAGGLYSAFHIRRGEFQYKEVKIPADQMMANVGMYIPQNELLFIATDERNKSFFDDFRPRFPVLRFLDDYMDIAGLRDINPNYLGMIDQIVCTRGHIFVGTWFSTFSGYITRMRGYMGYHDYSNYYGDKKHKNRFQHDELPMFPFYMREWNVSWTNMEEF